MRPKRALHPTLPIGHISWLKKTAKERNVFISELLEEVILYYQENVGNTQKYQSALFMVDQIVKQRLEAYRPEFEDTTKIVWDAIISNASSLETQPKSF